MIPTIRNMGAAAVLALVALSAAPASAAPTLYGVTGAEGSLSSLYTVDPVTGAATAIGATGFSHVTGLDFDPTTGTLYGVVSNGSGDRNLITIDTTTGAGTLVGPTANQIPDITIGPDGILRGWTETGPGGSDNPLVLDKTTGVATVTSSGLGTFQTGVATESATTIYVKPAGQLYSVDVGTGVATLLFDTGVSLDNLLENALEAGHLLTADRTGGGTQFYDIDVAAGTTTLLGFQPDVAFSAIAYSIDVPEPGTLAILGLGLAGLGLARRRKTA